MRTTSHLAVIPVNPPQGFGRISLKVKRESSALSIPGVTIRCLRLKPVTREALNTAQARIMRTVAS